MRFEDIKRVVDELLDMQPFPLESIKSTGGAGPSHAQTRPQHLIPSSPYLYSPTAPSTPPPYSPSHSLEPASRGDSVFIRVVRMSTV